MIPMTLTSSSPLFRLTRRMVGASAVCLVAALAAGCASKDKPKPTPLENFTAALQVRPSWSQGGGDVTFPLTVATAGQVFTLARDNGEVTAFNPETGAQVWKADAGAKLSAGVGSDGRFAAVVTRENELVVFNAGKPGWRQRLTSQVTTAPLVAGERVFVLALDRSVHAFDAVDGRKLWTFQRPGEALTLAHPGVLVPFKDTLVVGQGTKLVGLDPLRGTSRWEVTVASPRGTNEVERLADLVAPAARAGSTICVRAFQSAVGCVDAERASLLWSRNTGGADGVGAEDGVVLSSDASGRLTAWNRADGNVAWTADRLRYRNLSAPLWTGNAFVVGDGDGYVHWLSRSNGAVLQRLPTNGKAIAVAPVRVGSTVLVVTRNGGVYAFRGE
jgi:outer membrane protein assembly factor BamB